MTSSWRRAVGATGTRLSLLLAVSILAWRWPPTRSPRGKVYRVGFLSAGVTGSNNHLVEAFRQRLRELGWVEGQNIVIEYRFAEGRFERLPDLAVDGDGQGARGWGPFSW